MVERQVGVASLSLLSLTVQWNRGVRNGDWSTAFQLPVQG